MHTSTSRPHPPFLFGTVVFAAVALLTGRGVLPMRDPPVFSLESPAGIRVLLGSGFPDPGVHHFSDGMTLNGVIELTGAAVTFSAEHPPVAEQFEIVDGMTLKVVDSNGIPRIEQSWMPARQRLALGILLHPDRMSHDDWVSLPGIGEKLAIEIANDRQNFGDFGRFEALDRVKGIGPAKLRALKTFFVDNDK